MLKMRHSHRCITYNVYPKISERERKLPVLRGFLERTKVPVGVIFLHLRGQLEPMKYNDYLVEVFIFRSVA